ncbi:DUF3592 domain-containing protein [Kosakonia cowanii JCM 10956 = DSM 18146]|uniref:DUF3592 domain-containing protein n=2 Tax=Kosakonia cowanii TaxID=208223 RepID=A0A831EFN9_9ENTR|nr:DUF3592 domain-containing protein [Kosakonia cowanii JCM 10956 = DSM 18146]
MFDSISSVGTVLLVVVGVFAFGRMIVTEIMPTIKSGFTESRVAKTGVAVEADIIASHQTTSWGGNKPIYQITVHFKTQDGQEVEASIKEALALDEIDNYKAGNGLTIKYDPKDPKKIAMHNKPIILGE